MAGSVPLLRDLYYKQMLHHGGHALYNPPFATQFKPGSCGYFDDDGSGQWQPIVSDLSDAKELEEKGYKPLVRELERRKDDSGIEWGPKRSRDVTGRKIGLESSGSYPGIPVSAAAVFEYSTSSDIGAILMTEPPILQRGFYHDFLFFSWVKDNAKLILEQYPVVEKRGLWVVSTTFATKRCSHNVWSGKGKRVHVGFSVEAAGVGGMGPEGEWFEDKSDDGWKTFSAEGGDLRVIFFEGQKFSLKTRLLSRSNDPSVKQFDKKKQDIYRSGADGSILAKTESVNIDDTMICDIVCEEDLRSLHTEENDEDE